MKIDIAMATPASGHSGGMKRYLLHLLLISSVGIIIYSNTFHAPFVYDDISFMIDKPGADSSYLSYFTDPSKIDGIEQEQMMRRYLKTRHIGFLSLLANYRIGGLNVFGYHVVNLVIHILNAMLLYLLVALTSRTPALSVSSIKEYSPLIALFSALLFVSHPLQTEAVTYVVKRFSSLATMFYLLSIVTYAGYRLSTRGTSKVTLYSMSIVSAVIAMKTKEIAFTLPLALMMYEFMFLKGSFRRRFLLLLPLLLTLLIVPLAYLTEADSGDIGSMVEESTRFQSDMPRTEYLFTQLRVITTYLRLLLLPVNQNIDHDYTIYNSFLDPNVFISFLLLTGIMCTSLFLFYKSRSRAELRLVSFGLFWFFLALSVESSVIPLSEVIVEYRMYLPSTGAFIALVTALLSYRKMHKKRALVPVVLVLLTLSFAGATFERNSIWRDEIGLWEDTVRKSPRKARVHNNMGYVYGVAGKYDKAIEHHSISLSLNPDDEARVHNNLGFAYGGATQYDRAIEQFRISLSMEPDNAEVVFNLGLAYLQKGDIPSAQREMETALALDPNNEEVRKFLQFIYRIQESGVPGSEHKRPSH